MIYFSFIEFWSVKIISTPPAFVVELHSACNNFCMIWMKPNVSDVLLLLFGYIILLSDAGRCQVCAYEKFFKHGLRGLV